MIKVISQGHADIHMDMFTDGRILEVAKKWKKCNILIIEKARAMNVNGAKAKKSHTNGHIYYRQKLIYGFAP